VFNVGLQDHLMWDGREGDDLAHQAISAVQDHAEPGRAPTALEAERFAAFQRVLFSRPALAHYAAGGPEPELPPGRSQSEQRGRTFFVSGPLSASDMAHRGLCATCHSGPMLDTTNAFNPGDPPGLSFAGDRTSEFNARDLPEYTFRIALAQDLVVPPGTPLPIPPGTVVAPAGTELVVRTSDPDALIVDTDPTDGIDAANPCISPLPCITNPGTAIVFHRIPSLWGVGRTAPYFHDNSAATLEDVVRHYRGFFGPTEASLRFTADQAEALGDVALAMFLRDIADALVISDQDVTDIAAYMRLL
jgi:cytochrome c peroxidase